MPIQPALQLFGQLFTQNPKAQKAVAHGVGRVFQQLAQAGIAVSPGVQSTVTKVVHLVAEQAAQSVVTDGVPALVKAVEKYGPVAARAGKDALVTISESDLARIGSEALKNLGGKAARQVGTLGLTATELGALAIMKAGELISDDK
jgi:hypothetical protein